MKGRTPTVAQKRFHNQIASLGCIACLKDGWLNPTVSIHHIDGRTKPLAHWFVLGLCAGHHQDGTGIGGLIAVHPFKARFEIRYGRQVDLLTYSVAKLLQEGAKVADEALVAAGMAEHMNNTTLQAAM